MLSDVMEAIPVQQMFSTERCKWVDLALLRVGLRRFAITVGAGVGDVVGQHGAAVFKQSFSFDLKAKGVSHEQQAMIPLQDRVE